MEKGDKAAFPNIWLPRPLKDPKYSMRVHGLKVRGQVLGFRAQGKTPKAIPFAAWGDYVLMSVKEAPFFLDRLWGFVITSRPLSPGS